MNTNKMFRGIAAMFAAVALSTFGSDALAFTFDELRDQGHCTQVDRTPDCNNWIALTSCLTAQASATPGPTCTAMSTAASDALRQTRDVCGALGLQNGNQVSQISDLRSRLARCETPVPAAPVAAAPVRPAVHRVPICLSAPQYGRAITVIALRSGTICKVREHEVVEGGPECSHINPLSVVNAGCACPRGSALTHLGLGRGYFCAAVNNVDPVGVVTEGREALTARINDLSNRIDEAVRRLDQICLHVPASASTVMLGDAPEGAAAEGAHASPAEPTRSVDCAEMNSFINALLAASSAGNSTEIDRLSREIRVEHDTNVVQTTQIAELRRDVDALKRGWQVRMRLGVEGGLGLLVGTTPVYGTAGVQIRAGITPWFALIADVDALWGSYGTPLVGNITGYRAAAGIGFRFATGSITHSVDVEAALTTFADTGYHQVGTASEIAVFGDYRGRLMGARISYTLEYAGFGITPSVFVGTGDQVYGRMVLRGNRQVPVFTDNYGGIAALFGLTVSYGRGSF